MKLFENGALSSARLTPTASVISLLVPATDGNLDEVFLKINGRLHYLWRAVDQDGDVLDIMVQSKRDKKAAKKFFRKLMKGLRYVPRAIITDKLKSYSAAKAEVMPSVDHVQQKYQNNRAENSHQPTRLRERVMRRCKSAGHAQRFLSAFGIIRSHFRPGRHHCTVGVYRQMMKIRFVTWELVVGAQDAN
jgi:putative transposase